MHILLGSELECRRARRQVRDGRGRRVHETREAGQGGAESRRRRRRPVSGVSVWAVGHTGGGATVTPASALTTCEACAEDTQMEEAAAADDMPATAGPRGRAAAAQPAARETRGRRTASGSPEWAKSDEFCRF
eukprot:2661462-Prymnesium_polylepis.2